MTVRFRLRSLALCLALAPLGCGDAPDGPGALQPAPALAATGQVTLREDVPRLEADRWDAAVLAHDGPELWVRPENRGAPWLAPGAVTFVPRRGFLKVKEVTDEGDRLVVERDAYSFGEVIEDGDLAVEGRARFDEAFDDSEDDRYVIDMETRGAGKALYDTAKSFFVGGWKVDKDVHGDGDELHYRVTFTKDEGGLLGSIQIVGTVRNLETAFRVAVRNRTTTQQVSGVTTSGEADITWALAITDRAVGHHEIVMPGLVYKRAFLLGEVPMVLRVKTGMSVIVAATGRNTSTTGRLHVTHSTDGGIRIEGGEGSSDATGTGDASYDPDQGTAVVAPSAFGVLATLPKVELGVGVDGLFVAGASFTNLAQVLAESPGAVGGSPCAHVSAKLTGKVGLFLDPGIAKPLYSAMSMTDGILGKQIYEVERDGRACPR
jgi:hypothetical protein